MTSDSFWGTEFDNIFGTSSGTVNTVSPASAYVAPTAISDISDESNGFFSFLDSATTSVTDFFGNAVDKVADSSLADAWINKELGTTSTPEKQTDITGASPSASLSGASAMQYIKDNPVIAGGAVLALIASIVLIKKI